MNPKLKVTSAALTVLLAAAPALMAKPNKQKKQKHRSDSEYSQTAPGYTDSRQARDVFRRFDSNGDGAISRSEFPGDPSMFSRLDVDGNGYVTEREARQRMNRDFATEEARRLDTNRDGVISRSEWRGDLTTFRQLDRNGDGVLSESDRGRMDSMEREGNRFRGLDRDGDGRITRSEWRGNDVSFRQHDRNGDGVLSGSEMR